MISRDKNTINSQHFLIRQYLAVDRAHLLSQRAVEAVEHIPEVIIFPDIHLAAGWLLGIDAAQASGIVQGQDALQAAKVGQHCGALVELTIRLAQLGGSLDSFPVVTLFLKYSES